MRFRPYKIHGMLEGFLSRLFPTDGFTFEEGRAMRIGSKARTVIGGTSDVSSLHVQIIGELERFLHSPANPFPGKLAIEKCSFGWHTADVVIEDANNTYTIIEVKTSLNLRFNVRDALGQLLDYACWYADIPVKRFVIVSPEKIDSRHGEYFARIQAVLSLELHYWWYEQTTGVFHL